MGNRHASKSAFTRKRSAAVRDNDAQSPFEQVPDDLLRIMFGHLSSQRDILSFRAVNVRFCYIAGDECRDWRLKAYRTAAHDSCVKAICASFPNLRKLSLRGCKFLSDHSAKYISRLTNLEELDLFGCAQLNDRFLIRICDSVTHLTAVDLTCCRQTLRLRFNPNLNDDILINTLSKMASIKELDLSNCPLITDIGVETILRNCSPSLRKLRVIHCQGLSQRAICHQSLLLRLSHSHIIFDHSFDDPELL